ncbi:MAG: hypothetical protein ACOC54_01355 [Candidatus Sumerlaeota bacterium]
MPVFLFWAVWGVLVFCPQITQMNADEGLFGVRPVGALIRVRISEIRKRISFQPGVASPGFLSGIMFQCCKPGSNWGALTALAFIYGSGPGLPLPSVAPPQAMINRAFSAEIMKKVSAIIYVKPFQLFGEFSL